jgi:cell fate regulator YaaT (PSP1 superfamily)
MGQILVGIRFSEYGQVVACRCDPASDPLSPASGAMVPMAQGLCFGRVVWRRGECSCRAQSGDGEDCGSSRALSLPVARPATESELAAAEGNELLCREAREYCRKCVAGHGLEMKLVDVETLFDRSKLIFYFTAPSRIDFRELVKDLVRRYHTRIELRQIGVRHETQMLGALGNCGMVCCCRRYLRTFTPVTIKAAKEQNLFLNPAKISGVCGRLLCCLSYEQENYDAFYRACPKLGKRYQTDRGTMRALRGNVFRNSVVALPDGGQEVEFTLEEWQNLHPRRAEPQVFHPPAARRPEPDFPPLPAEPGGEDNLDALFGGLEREESPAPAEAFQGRSRRHRRKSGREAPADRNKGPR